MQMLLIFQTALEFKEKMYYPGKKAMIIHTAVMQKLALLLFIAIT